VRIEVASREGRQGARNTMLMVMLRDSGCLSDMGRLMGVAKASQGSNGDHPLGSEDGYPFPRNVVMVILCSRRLEAICVRTGGSLRGTPRPESPVDVGSRGLSLVGAAA
jgi:hypothetical protein